MTMDARGAFLTITGTLSGTGNGRLRTGRPYKCASSVFPVFNLLSKRKTRMKKYSSNGLIAPAQQHTYYNTVQPFIRLFRELLKWRRLASGSVVLILLIAITWGGKCSAQHQPLGGFDRQAHRGDRGC